MSVLSRLARDWAERCFGIDHVRNFPLRALRTLEESAELAQALNVPKETALKCIETVYSRPVGDVEQEMGGVLHTMNIMCEAMNLEPDGLAERELRRVLAKSPKQFAARNQVKLDLGLDAGGSVPVPVEPNVGGETGRWTVSRSRKAVEAAADRFDELD